VLEGNPGAIVAATQPRTTWRSSSGDPRFLGELACWRRRADSSTSCGTRRPSYRLQPPRRRLAGDRWRSLLPVRRSACSRDAEQEEPLRRSRWKCFSVGGAAGGRPSSCDVCGSSACANTRGPSSPPARMPLADGSRESESSPWWRKGFATRRSRRGVPVAGDGPTTTCRRSSASWEPAIASRPSPRRSRSACQRR